MTVEVMDEVMIDFETLDVVASAVIMSIGAVRFDINSDRIDEEGFYASVSIDSNTLLKRTISESTLIWWMGQSPDAQRVFHEPKQSLEAALESFTEWFGSDRAAQRRTVWSNGADFDIPMMTHAYNHFDQKPPWGPFNGRCFRTYKNLPAAKNVPKPAAGIKHNALSDAIAQAKHIQAIHRAMTRPGAAKVNA